MSDTTSKGCSVKGDRAILVVDVNPLVRTTAKQMIRSEHPEVEVVEAARFESALQIVKSCHPHILITDIHLKDGSGLKLAEVVSTRFPETVIVVFTNADGPEYRDEALRKGASDFVSKTDPNGGVLMDIVRKRLSQHREDV